MALALGASASQSEAGFEAAGELSLYVRIYGDLDLTEVDWTGLGWTRLQVPATAEGGGVAWPLCSFDWVTIRQNDYKWLFNYTYEQFFLSLSLFFSHSHSLSLFLSLLAANWK